MPVVPVSSNKFITCLPLFVRGTVIHGFGRGSKQLGIPTANFSEKVVEQLPSEITCGIYYGWASVDNESVYKMVMSIGWNPYYKNEKKSMETHIIHEYPKDFYGSTLKVIILGYLRSEKNFASLDELISAIKLDISNASEALENPEMKKYKNNEFFKDPNSLKENDVIFQQPS